MRPDGANICSVGAREGCSRASWTRLGLAAIVGDKRCQTGSSREMIQNEGHRGKRRFSDARITSRAAEAESSFLRFIERDNCIVNCECEKVCERGNTRQRTFKVFVTKGEYGRR